jgi:hypothetical protein
MNLESMQAELAKLGYRAVKMRKAKAPSLTIWAKRRIARAYKGPTLAECIAARARPEHVAQQARDWMRVALWGPRSAASHDHVGPKRLMITSQYMHLDRRAEPEARTVASPVYLPDAAELSAWDADEREAWADAVAAEAVEWADKAARRAAQ